MECYSCYNPSFICFVVKERGANMYKKFNQKEAWQYILKNIPLIKHRLNNKNITFNKEDIMQDTILLLFNKISSKTLKINEKGNIYGFQKIIDNAIIDVLRTNYSYVKVEFPTDMNISHDLAW